MLTRASAMIVKRIVCNVENHDFSKNSAKPLIILVSFFGQAPIFAYNLFSSLHVYTRINYFPL
jgi:hypothetical protein